MAVSYSEQIQFSSLDTFNAAELGLEALSRLRSVLAALSCLVSTPEGTAAATDLCSLALSLLAEYEDSLADARDADLPMAVPLAYAAAQCAD